MLSKRLQLILIAQALEDVLRYELGLPLIAAENQEEREEAYEDALVLLLKYPTLTRRLRSRCRRTWLKELDNARKEI